jgi:hypothetical protein
MRRMLNEDSRVVSLNDIPSSALIWNRRVAIIECKALTMFWIPLLHNTRDT